MNIIGAGLITVDIVQLCNSRWRPKAVAPFYTAGGTVGNILSYLAAFGYDCSIAGIVGEDEMATVLRQDLRASGVKTDHLISLDGVSTRRIGHLVSIEGRNRGTHKFLMHCFNCKIQFPKVPIPNNVDSRINESIGAKTLLIIDRANTFTLELARSTATKRGVVVFEPGHVPSESNIISQLMEYVDVLKYSEELIKREEHFERFILTNPSRLRLIVQTRGKGGVKLILPRRNSEIRLNTTYKTRDMKFVDSSGAGDAFTAGFLMNVGMKELRNVDKLENERLEAAINYGQAMGALACLFYGSKGLLYAKAREDIKQAVKSITRSRMLPADFHKTGRVKLKKFRSTREGICRVCRLRLK